MGSGVKTVSPFTSQGCWGRVALTARLSLKVKVNPMAMVICLSSHHAFCQYRIAPDLSDTTVTNQPQFVFVLIRVEILRPMVNCSSNATDQERTLRVCVFSFFFVLSIAIELLACIQGYEFTAVHWVRAKLGTDVVVQPVFPSTVISECKLYKVSRWTNNMSMFSSFTGLVINVGVVVFAHQHKNRGMNDSAVCFRLHLCCAYYFWGQMHSRFRRFAWFPKERQQFCKRLGEVKWFRSNPRSKVLFVVTPIIKHTCATHELRHVKQWLHWYGESVCAFIDLVNAQARGLQLNYSPCLGGAFRLGEMSMACKDQKSKGTFNPIPELAPLFFFDQQSTASTFTARLFIA